MNSRFLNWYTQSLGATFGIMACIYAYLNGNMYVYSNILKFFDYIGIFGVIASYFLLPLCVLTLLLGLIKSYASDLSKKSIFGISLLSINQFVVIATVVIGFFGAKLYFLIPTIFILFDTYTHTETFNNIITKIKLNKEVKKEKLEKIKNNKSKAKSKTTKNKVNSKPKTTYNKNTYKGKKLDKTIVASINSSNDTVDDLMKDRRVLKTKEIIALDLLEKNSDKQFIMEITGFSNNEIMQLEKKLKRKAF